MMIVPTICMGIHSVTLRVTLCSAWRLRGDGTRSVRGGIPTPQSDGCDHTALAAIASTSTNAPGNGNATTCNAVRAGLFGCSGVPKNWV